MSETSTKTIDMIDGKFDLPDGVEYPVTIRFPFSTQRIGKVNKFGIRSIQMWFRKDRQLLDDEIMIDGEIYKVREINIMGDRKEEG